MAIYGRLWQIDKRGYLTNEASQENIPEAYQPIIDDIVHAFVDHIGEDIHSIYVTGSVPRGLAIRGQSDINVFAVLEYYTEPELVMQDWLPIAETDISEKYSDIVSDVRLEIWTHGWLLDDPAEFSISAFILKTHATCIWGIDMSPDVSNYRFTDKIIRLAIANDDIVQIEPDIEEAIDAMQSNPSKANVRFWSKQICKNIIHTLFGLVMADEVVHTRDIDLSVQYILKHYPAQQTAIKKTTEFIHSPTDSAEVIIDHLNNFGQWVIKESNTWLDEHNPDRYLELAIGDELD
jgi:hypothetical protein